MPRTRAVCVSRTLRLKRSRKQRTVPAAPALSSAIRSFHSPVASSPYTRESGCSGLNSSSANGGLACAIGVSLASVKMAGPLPHGRPTP